jgi:hypothetical protein
VGAVKFLPLAYWCRAEAISLFNLNRSTVSRLLGAGTLRQIDKLPGLSFSSWSVLVSWSRLWVGSSKRVDNTTTRMIWAASRPLD